MKPITLDLKPSAILALIFGVVTLVFMACVLLSPISLPLKICLSLVMLASALFAITTHALLLMPKSIVQVRIIEDGVCLLKNKQGDEFEITIAGDSVVHPLCSTLYYKSNGFLGLAWGQVILLSADRVNANDFRALRVWLLWHKQDS